MKVNEVVKQVMRKTGITQMQMAERFGFKTQAAIGSRLRSEGMRTDNFIEMLNVCGYTVEIKNPDGKAEYVFAPEVTSDEKDC